MATNKTVKGGDQTKLILSGLNDINERLQTLTELVEKGFKLQSEQLKPIYEKVIVSDHKGESSTTKKHTKRERSPNEPRKPPSAYLLFSNGERPKFQEKYEGITDKGERKKKIDESLKKLWDNEKIKNKYTKKYEEMKEEHEKKMAAYKAKKANETGEDSEEPKTPKKTKGSKKKAPVVEDSDDDNAGQSGSSDEEVTTKLRGKTTGKKTTPSTKELDDLLKESDTE